MNSMLPQFEKPLLHGGRSWLRIIFGALALLLACATTLPSQVTGSAASASEPQQLASPDQVPEGLAKSDWTSIRAAYEAGRHQFYKQDDGSHVARNPGLGWKMEFDARGFTARPRNGDWEWGLELQRDADTPVCTSDSELEKSPSNTLQRRLTPAIVEWFINDSRGLEQGWTLSAPAEIRLRVRGNLKPTVSPQSVRFGDQITYSGLKAWDATGKVIPSHFEATEEGFAVRYDDAGAQYPITIDPIAQQAYLKPAAVGTTQAGDNFGGSVAISGDTVVIGARQEDGSSTGVNSALNDDAAGSGAAYIFVRNGATWSQQAYLKPANVGTTQVGDLFGTSVAIFGDTVVIGAFSEDGSVTGVDGVANEAASAAGAAYVFVRSGTIWSQQAYLKANQVSANDGFGRSVAIAGDTIVVGAPGEDGSATGVNGTVDELADGAGAAYVFVRNGSTWSQQAYLKAGQVTALDQFGTALAIAGDIVVVGAPLEDGSASGINGVPDDVLGTLGNTGAAYVFVRNGSNWSQQAYLKAGQVSVDDRFAGDDSVAISGNTIVIGSTGEDGGATGVNGNVDETVNSAGAAYVFVRNGTAWSQQAYLKANEVSANDLFGGSVAIAGEMVVVGAEWEDGSSTGVNGASNESANDAGAAYVFIRNGASWTQQAYLKASQVTGGDQFGNTVAIAGDTAIIGAILEDSSSTGVNGLANESAANSGAAYVFTGLVSEQEIAIEQPVGTSLTDAASTTEFGSAALASAGVTKTFTIRNLGILDITGMAVTKSGLNASDFVVDTTGMSNSLAPGGSTTFTVTFLPMQAGSRSATLQIASNDADENPFDITLSGAGNLVASFSSKATVPVTSNGFTATGSTVNLTLNYAPTTGDEMLVVNNTSLDPINGTFSNLANGQTVTLTYGGVNYDFVAYYYGGEGYNDLVLLWKNRRLVSWGYNNARQLGDNSTITRNAPVVVNNEEGTSALAGKNVVSIATGESHSLALCTDGTVLAWGQNGGRLGDNTNTDRSVPVVVNTTQGISVLYGKRVVAIAAGGNFSMAMCSDGTLATWGTNEWGQLGIGSSAVGGGQASVLVPVAVSTEAGLSALYGKKVARIAAGTEHCLALTTDGIIVSWGGNSQGQLGDNSTTYRTRPVLVNSTSGTSALFGKTARLMSCGQVHNLVLCTDGTLVSWGSGGGELGDNTSTQRNVPVLVNVAGGVSSLFGKTVTLISAGENHSLALCSDGVITAWGDNGSRRVTGSDPAGTDYLVPVLVNAGSGGSALIGVEPVSIHAGNKHSLALASNGSLIAWGSHSFGEIGNGPGDAPTAPTLVSTSSFSYGERFVAAATGFRSQHNLAIVAAPPYVPEIAVEEPVGTGLADGAANTSFGTATIGNGGVVKTFTVQNLGAAPLTGLAVSKTGPGAGDFSIGVLGATTLAAGASTTFTIQFSPSQAGSRSATIQIASNDADESVFDIVVTGMADLTATYASKNTIPLTSSGCTATGSTVNLTLNYAPTTGDELMVVNNTGLSFIQGTFSNLEQGQTVNLVFSGVTYPFVADYYGGTGNDLVLVWKRNRLMAWGSNQYGNLGDGTTTRRYIPTPVASSGVLAGKTILKVAAGAWHSLALCSDGTLVAWGKNQYGEVGDGTNTPRSEPVLVSTTQGVSALYGKRVVSISSGAFHSLALCSDGTLVAWGRNDSGQIGDGTKIDRHVPVAVDMTSVGSALNGRSVVAIGCGYDSSYALSSDGTLYSWGSNYYGKLGDNTLNERLLPVAVNTSSGVSALHGKTVVQIAPGFYHCMALCSDGTVATWGNNDYGQLGDDSTNTDRYAPVAVNTADGVSALFGKTVVSIAASLRSLALCSDGTLTAWGFNDGGSLGNNSNVDSSMPVVVNAANGVSALFGRVVTSTGSGGYHSFALCADGSLASWGRNFDGQLGISNTTSERRVPTLVNTTTLATGEKFSRLFSGMMHNHSLAIVSSPEPEITVEMPVATNIPDGTGTAHFGTVASGGGVLTRTFTIRNTGGSTLTNLVITKDGADSAHFVVGALGSTSVAAGGTTTFDVTFSPTRLGNHSAAIHIASNVLSAANPYDIALTGVGTGAYSAAYASRSTVPVTSNGFTATSSTVNLTLNYPPTAGDELMVVNNTGLPFIQGTFSNLAQGQTVALPFGTAVYNFVANYYGGTGNDLVLVWAKNRLVAWGNNESGEIGNGTVDNTTQPYGKLVPVSVSNSGVLAGKTVISTAAGTHYSLALLSDGSVASWGSNAQGQLGDNTQINRPLPVLVNTTAGVSALHGRKVIAISAGGSHSLALCSDGKLVSWGYNGNGTLGDGTRTDRLVPVLVSDEPDSALFGKTVMAISAGRGVSMALCSDGSVITWGRTNLVGNGTTAPDWQTKPVFVNQTNVSSALFGKTVTAIAAGAEHCLALCSDGTLTAWGSNQEGKLGDNSITERLNPAQVNTSQGVSALYGKTVVKISAGLRHNLALCSDGTLTAWGYNSEGGLGNNSTTQSLVPVPVNQLNGTSALFGRTIAHIYAGSDHSLTFNSDTSICAWGHGDYGSVGDNTRNNRTVPVLTNTSFLMAQEKVVGVSNCTIGKHNLAIVASPPPPPTVTTLAATSITGTSVVLNGTINANGSGAAASFDYGTSTGYGSNAASTPAIVTGDTNVAVSATLTGLQPGTTYFFRARGTDTVGSGLSFTTLSANANLTSLALSSGSLSPAFDAGTISYTASVGYRTYSLTVTPTKAQANATITVNGVAVSSGASSGSIPLSVGPNVITTVVTAQDGTTTKTYTMTVTRAAAAPGDVLEDVPVNASNDVITLMHQPDGKLVVGGGFTTFLGQTRNFLARLNANHTLDGGFAPDVQGNKVFATVLQPDGRIIIGGKFISVNGVTRNNIARLNADGTLDASYNPNLDNAVYCMLPMPDGRLLVGGSFFTVGATTRKYLAMLHADGTLDTSFNADLQGEDPLAYAMALARLPDGKLLIVGDFTNVGGTSRVNVARLNANGTLDTSFQADATGSVRQVIVQPDGKILLGGFFTQVAGQPRNRVARLNADGSLDSGFNPNANNHVFTMTLQTDGKIILGGWFTSVGGSTRNRGARLNADGTLDSGFDPDFDDAVISSLIRPDGKIWIGGGFQNAAGLSRSRLVLLSNTASTQSLAATAFNRVEWLRGATSPEAIEVFFEASNDGGSTYTPLGWGQRITGGWELQGIGLPGSGLLRGRARVPGGQHGGSSGLVETVVSLSGLAVPDIAVFNGTTLTAPNERVDNTGVQSFGTADLASVNTVQTFSIRNDGTMALSGLALSIAGAQAGDFTLGSLGATTLAPGATTTFSVTFTPQGFGARNAVISLASNDFDETPFEIAVTGTGGNALAANFTAANTIPLTTNGFTATGSSVNLSLGFAPSPFSTLTVVNNTSANPISGVFSNLVQGQTVTLSLGGNDYRYFADYFGGDGNDLMLVLQGPGVLDYTFNESGRVMTGIGSGDDQAQAVAVQPDGKVVVAGKSFNGANFDFAVVRKLPDGTDDLSFNGSGRVTTTMSAGDDVATCVAIQPDGKILVGGYTSGANKDFALARYLSNGTLDVTFNSTGKYILDLGTSYDTCYAMALQSNGKIVLAGDSFNGGNTDFTLVRLSTDGSLDTTFNGTGKVITDFGGGSDGIYGLTLQPDGKVVVAGYSYSGANVVFALARYNSNGDLDTGFNGTGKATAAFGTDDQAQSVVVQADGKMVVVGSYATGGPRGFAIARFLANGSLDTTFNGTGKATPALGSVGDLATGVRVQADGRILVAGSTAGIVGSDFALIRFLASGALDTTFHGTGKVITAIGLADDQCLGMAVQSDGKIVLAGQSFNGSNYDFALARYMVETTNAVTFAAASDVPLSSTGLTATGRTLNITLGFTPNPGTNLKVFENTSLRPINGEFVNMAHGQTVTLSHNAVNFDFVANYFGGDGNDLTLEWAGTKLASFGSNGSGQLGITGTAAQANVPMQVVATAPIYQKTILGISAGETHSLAVCSDGSVAAWGSNANGQLGNGTTTSSTAPVVVTMSGVLNGKKVIAVAAGAQHSLALCSDGTLAAWGDGSFGQIGDNGVLDRSSPVLVSTAGALNGKRVIAISAGANHSAALCSDGTVVCWGSNTNGELGNASNTQSNVPVAVTTSGVLLGRTAVAIACGENHTLALLADGAVAAWGRNASGQLGNSSTAASHVPVLVSTSGLLNGKRVVEITAGGSSNLARCSDGVLAAWGLNDRGQLGVNNATASYTTPQAVLMSGVLSGKTVARLLAGKNHAGALCIDGTLATWGEGNGGELGDNAVSDSLAPVLANNTILGGTDVFVQTASGASAGHSLAVIGTATNAPMIQVEENGAVLADSTTTGPNYGGLLIGSAFTKTFTVRNTGTQTLGGLAASLSGTGVAHYAVTIQPAASLAPGEATQIVVTFGPTSFGAKEAVLLITNSTDPFNAKLTGTGDPELIATWLTGAEIPAEAMNFDAGGKEVIFNLGFAPPAGTTLMVLRNNSMGFIDGLFDSAEYGQLAHGQDVDLEYNGTFYSFVANYFGGDGNDLVLQWAGTRLLAWGANTNGSLGNGSSTNSSLPVSVNMNGVLSGKRLVAAACGLRHSLVLCSDGTLAAWGNNSAGQLGNGALPTAHSNVPVLVNMGGGLLGKTPIAIAAGNDFSLALCSDGTVAAWGLNTDGQLGNNSVSNSNVPVLVDTSGVLSGKIIIGIVAGSAHVLARGSDGALYAWGSNSNGQLGNNSLVGSQVPLLVNSGVLAGKQVLRMAAGYFHSMVTCTDGTQAAWGDNSYGMIGDGTPTASLVPVLTDTNGVLAEKTPIQQFGGQFHSVWMAADGTLAAWGRNNNAQLGISTATPYSLVPLAVPLTGAMSGRVPVFLAAGRQHHVTLLDDGTLAAWGLGSSGQLGHGATPSNVTTPVAVSTTSLQAGEKVMRVYSGTGALHNISLIAKPLTLPGGPPVASTNPATVVDKTTATLNALVNPNSLATDARFEYGLTTSYGTQTTLQTNIGSGSSSVSVTQSLTSLQPNTTYHYRVIATNIGGSVQGNNLTFNTLPDPPVAVNGAATAITNTTAVVNGSVNPNTRATTVFFRVSTDPSFVTNAFTTAPQNISAGSSFVGVSAPLSGLLFGTTYYYRLVAQNAAGEAEHMAAQSFTTTSVGIATQAPTISSTTAVNLTTTSARLQGSVNAHGGFTNVFFEYGASPGFGTNSINYSAGSGTSPQTMTHDISGLLPATQYQFRLVAENNFNNSTTTTGTTITFTTLPLPPIVETHAAAALSTTSARLNGKVNAQNGSAAVTFEWGTNGVNFPNSLAAVPSPVTGSSLADVSVDLANLAQFTTYHFRVKAVSAGGTTTGSVLTFQPAIISGLTQQFPTAPPASNGSLTVTLAPTGLLSGWRFVGEHRWRASGDTASGLVLGSRVIEFRPVPGYLQPGADSVNVTANGQMADYEYYATPSSGTGGILVVLKPDTLAQASNVANRGQWRLLGEITWRDSATTASALPAGSYLVECKAVSGYSTPVLVNISVSSGQTVNPTIVYGDAFSPTGTPPSVLSFSTVSTDATKPYGYVGQIRSNSGVGTGFAVKSRVVATAAHVVFDEGTLSSVQGLQWLLQEDAGGHEPLQVTPRGYYLIDGYATQRATETPGSFSLASRQKDVAALYFINDTDAARNGFAGFLASDLTNNEFLISNAQKMLVGYPVDGIGLLDQGRMHATPAANLSFTGLTDRVFATTGIRSTGGNSGGPLCVQHTNGNWYPAAIYLGGATQSIVRAIDSTVIQLFNTAQQSGIDDQGYTGGGITHTGYTAGGTASTGALRVNITPAGTGWRPVGSTKAYTPSGSTRSGLTPGTFSIEFTPLAGYQTPANQSVTVVAASTQTYSITYASSQTPQETWRQTFFGNTANTGNAADTFDFDNDGFTNAQEYAAGTNPTLSGDFFKATNPQLNGHTFSVSAAGKAGRSYVLERSANLSTWTPVDTESSLAADGPVTLTDPASTGDAFFYRIRVTGP